MFPIFIKGKLNPTISEILSDDNNQTCFSFGQGTPFANYDLTVLKIETPSATPFCPTMFFRMIYDDFLEDYTNSVLLYTSTSESQNEPVTSMTLCQGIQNGNLTDGLITKLYTCSCPPGCSLFIQIGSEALSLAKLTYKICEAISFVEI